MPKWLVCTRNLLVALSLFFIFACGGGQCNGEETSNARWTFTGPGTAFITAGSTKNLNLVLECLSASERYSLVLTNRSSLPAGWVVSASPNPVSVFPPKGTKFNTTLSVTVPAGMPASTRSLTIRATEDGIPDQWKEVTIVVTVGAASVTTGIRESMPMIGNASNLFEGQAEISNGEGVPICTMLGITPLGYSLNTDAIIWMRPNSGGFCVDPGDKQYVTVCGVARTNLAGRTFTQDFHFNHGATVYSYSTNWTVTAATNVGYSITAIDYWMGQKMGDPDKTTTYSVTVDPILSGRPGLYTFSVQGLPTQYSASVVPASVAINSAGDPVSVQVTVTRIADSAREETDEFTLAAVHESSPDINLALRLPISNTLGRLGLQGVR